MVNQKGGESPHPNKRSRSNRATVSNLGFVLIGLALIASAFSNLPVQVSGLVNVRLSHPRRALVQIVFGAIGFALLLLGLARLFDPVRHATAARPEIAAILNRRGLKPKKAEGFTSRIVRALRRSYGLTNRFSRLRQAGLLTGAELASEFGVCCATVEEWLPAEAKASALSRFTVSRVLDAQIELTREGLRHTWSPRRRCRPVRMWVAPGNTPFTAFT